MGEIIGDDITELKRIVESIEKGMEHEDVKAIIGRYYVACAISHVSPEDHQRFQDDIVRAFENIKGE